MKVDAWITEEAADGNQLLIVNLEDVASLDALGDNLLGEEALAKVDVEYLVASFLVRHGIEEAMDGVARNLVALGEGTEADGGAVLGFLL